MRRREFLGLVYGAAGAMSAWPLDVRAQQGERQRSIGVLNSLSSTDSAGHSRIAAFMQGLQQSGWTVGLNLRIESRWAGSRADDFRKYAAELIEVAPDLILATGSAAVASLMQASRSVPVVFVNVIDPVGAGFVESLARPGGNVTGFTQFEYSTSGKWLELLKEIAPRVTRAVVLRDPSQASGLGQFAAIQSAAPALGVEIRPVNMREAAEIERALGAFAHQPNGGLIVTAGALAVRHRDLIVALAARYKLPAVYNQKFFVVQGGLLSYGPDLHEHYRLAAGYADRILRGEKPADLPVQTAMRFELAVNVKTAKALGFIVPQSLLARADEVIE